MRCETCGGTGRCTYPSIDAQSLVVVACPGLDGVDDLDSALDFLVNAARVSPVLRDRVRIVDEEIRRLRTDLSRAEALVMNVAMRCVREPDVAAEMVADERDRLGWT